MVEVGDLVLVESEKVGAVTRSGVVTDVDGRLITVRWDSGSSSMFAARTRAGYSRVQSHWVRSCSEVVTAQTEHSRAVRIGSSQAWVSYTYSPSPPAARRSTRSGARVS